jgi:hypothetical protein
MLRLFRNQRKAKYLSSYPENLCQRCHGINIESISAPGGHAFLAPGEVFKATDQLRREGCALCKILVESFDDEFLFEQRYEIDRYGMRLTLTE